MTRSLESRIDDLYRRPPGDFMPARKALASEVTGADRRRVQALKKPASAAWAVNQVYWHARPDFDRLTRSGQALRQAQGAALKGRAADLREAVAAHRDAVAAAVARAIALAAPLNVHPARDALTQTFEALSVAPPADRSAGRLTEPLRPGGFEMLAGVAPAPIRPERESPGAARRPKPGTSDAPVRADRGRADRDARRLGQERRDAERAARARAREEAAARRRRDAAVRKAEAVLERARDRAAEAERAWKRAQQDVDRATDALRAARSIS